MSPLYILEVKPTSEVSLANMFSHTVGSLFILMLISLAMQKLFNLMRYHLFILSFLSVVLGEISVKMLLCGMSEIILPVFSLRTFMVLRLIFSLLSALIYFCVWHKLVLSFIFLHIAVQISQHHLLKRLFLLLFMLLPPLSNIN